MITRSLVSRVLATLAFGVLSGCGGDLGLAGPDAGTSYMHADVGLKAFVGRFGVYATVSQGVLTITGSDEAGNNVSLVLFENLIEPTNANGKQEFIVHTENTQTVGFARYAHKIGDDILYYSTGSAPRSGSSSGSIGITRYTDTNVQGTFSFSGCLPTGFEATPECTSVLHGEFSVGIAR